jgi:diacylglycerol kinase family enzyme
MNYLAIINPASRNGCTGRRLAFLEEKLREQVVDYRVTSKPGDATVYANNSKEYECLIAIGGDGTICEILQGMDFEKQSLAILPSGTGNSLARDFGIESIGQITNANSFEPKLCDLLDVTFTTADNRTDSWFSASTVALGYAARVVAKANQTFKPLGRFCYPISAIAETFNTTRQPFSICNSNGQLKVRQLSSLMIGNTRFAGNFKAFPQALADDGRFDVIESDAGMMEQNMYNISVLSQMHCYVPAELYNETSMTIQSATPQPLLIDGEIIDEVMNVRITIIPGVLKCLTGL